MIPEDPKLILCDRCGRDCRATDQHPGFDPEMSNPLEGHLIYEGSYGSTRYDLSIASAQLCEDCVVDVIAFINAGRPDSPEGPVRGRGVQVIDDLVREQIAFCHAHGIPTSVTLDDGSVMPCLQPDKIDQDEFRRWLEQRHAVRLPR
jgi:hypothetical protein